MVVGDLSANGVNVVRFVVEDIDIDKESAMILLPKMVD